MLTTNVFDAFGKLLSGTAGDPRGYEAQDGYFTDAETGLISLSYRYYDPAQGRFLNRDPIGFDGGINLHGYVGNDSTTGSDPAGLMHGPESGAGELEGPLWGPWSTPPASSTGGSSGWSIWNIQLPPLNEYQANYLMFSGLEIGGGSEEDDDAGEDAAISAEITAASSAATADGASDRVLNVCSGTRPLPNAVNIHNLADPRFPDKAVDPTGYTQMMERVMSQGSFVKGDACQMPFADNSFGEITGRNVPSLLLGDAAFRSELRRVLAPGGTCSVSAHAMPPLRFTK